MKRILSLLLAIGLVGGASLVAQETKKAPAKKPAAPAVKQPADVAAPKLGPDGKPQAGFLKSHESFVEIAKKGEVKVKATKAPKAKSTVTAEDVLDAVKA